MQREFKEYRKNKINSMLRTSKRQHYLSAIEKSKSDIKETRKILKSCLLKTNKRSENCPNTFEINNVKSTANLR